MGEHFNCQYRTKYTNINENNYIKYAPKTNSFASRRSYKRYCFNNRIRNRECISYEQFKSYPPEFIEMYTDEILISYHLNMEYFKSLDHDIFNKELEAFVLKNKFVDVWNLKKFKDVSGYYIMVLDEYNQCYIGWSKNIYNRIKQHWGNQKSFDRLLFPFHGMKSSTISIDSFRILDTTRIFVKPQKDYGDSEEILVNGMNKMYTLNRIGGGIKPTDNDFIEKAVKSGIERRRDLSDEKEIDLVSHNIYSNMYDIFLESKRIQKSDIVKQECVDGYKKITVKISDELFKKIILYENFETVGHFHIWDGLNRIWLRASDFATIHLVFFVNNKEIKDVILVGTENFYNPNIIHEICRCNPQCFDIKALL